MQETTDRLMLNVPHAIRDIPGWLLWKLQPRKGGGFDKMPYYVTTKGTRNGTQGTPEDRANLVTFKAAMEAFQGGGFDGVGIATLPGFGIVAGDFDDKKGEGLHPEAAPLANTTYAEKSPSGKGIRALWLGSMDTAKNNTIGVEVFGSTGFVTITGNVVNDLEPVPLPAHVRVRLEALTGAVNASKAVVNEATTVVDDATVRDLRSALNALSADDYEQWVDMGHALKELGNVGRGLWLDWSQTSDKFQPSDAGKWATFKPTKTGYQAVFARAQRAGWANPAAVGAPPPPPAVMQFITPQEVELSDLATFAPSAPSFWADEILPADVVTLLGAHGGTGKTTLALYGAVCLAMGLPFLGKLTKRARALFYSGEDDADLLRWRLASVCKRLQVDPAMLGGWLRVIDASASDSVLFVEASHKGVRIGQPTESFAALCATMAAYDTEILILDNASDVYGADENNRAQVRAFIRLLAATVRPMHGAVLLLAHVDKMTARGGGTQGYSGSTAWHNSVRSRLFLSEEQGGLKLEHQKSNRGAKAAPMRLEWEDGLPVLATHEPSQGVGNDLIEKIRQKAVLDLLGEFYDRGEYASTSTGGAHNNLYKLLKNERGFPSGMAKEDFWTLIRNAERQGVIHRESYVDAYRKDRERWRPGSAPSAPSCAFINEDAQHAGGAPSAPSCVGGMGGERSAKESAMESANDAPPVPKTRKPRAMKAQKVA